MTSRTLQTNARVVGIFVVLLALLGGATAAGLLPPMGVTANAAGNTFADLLIVWLTFSRTLFSNAVLAEWYNRYGLAAMLADTLIGVLYIGLTQGIASFVARLRENLLLFALAAVAVQVVGDLLFYLFFRNTPKDGNQMLRFFTDWAKSAGPYAVVGDSALVLVAVLVAALVQLAPPNVQVYLLLLLVYLCPFFAHSESPRAASSVA